MVAVTLPWSVDLDGYTLEIKNAGRYVKIKASNCLEIMFDGSTKVEIHLPMDYQGKVSLFLDIRSSQCSTTGVTKAVVFAILSVGWYI